MKPKASIIIALLLTLTVPVFPAQDKIEYLALGDSIAFGFDRGALPIASNYTGYPEIVAQKANKQFDGLVNLSCPGETSGTFISTTAPAPRENCQAFKAGVGLHTNYSGPQMDFAIQLLRSTPQIKLVTIDIGGNDLIMLQENCLGQPACILGQLPATLATYQANLRTIFRRIREEGRYNGRMILVTTYSPDYRDPLQVAGVGAMNAAALPAAILYKVAIADGFGAFAAASLPFGGNVCAAGLLLPGVPPNPTCDQHPSPKGRDLLADTVLRLLPGTK